MDKLQVPEGKYVIGLTGNIATGKSAIMKLAEEQGALTIDADKIVHEIQAGDVTVQAAIVDAFGPAVRKAGGGINRPALGKIVFSDPNEMRKLEAIIHPAVHRHLLSRIESSAASVVMIEAIKLLEGKLRHICNMVWVATCSRERQLERLKICRGLDEETAVMRVDAQAPQSEKVRQADIVIDTGGLMEETKQQFDAAWLLISQES